MRRWNGWGDTSHSMTLSLEALSLLRKLIGEGHFLTDMDLDSLVAKVPPSRIMAQGLISIDPTQRLLASFGESYGDWLGKRLGVCPIVPDAVAYPSNRQEVRELLDLAVQQNWIIIPFAGGTSVAGHLTPPLSQRPLLSLNLSKLSGLIAIDKEAQLASFGAGSHGPIIESELSKHGFTLGHFPQSFEYSTLGGWIVTRSSGQQSLRYGRIEHLFAGGHLETPIGGMTIPTLPASSAGPDMREIIMGSEGRFGVLTEASVRITPIPQHESFHAFAFHNWNMAVDAVRSLAQRKLGLSMLRLSNENETMTSLALAGHVKSVKLLETYLRWRGCGTGKCFLMMGVSGEAVATKLALKQAKGHLSGYGAVYIGKELGRKWAANRFKGPYLRNSLWEKGYSADTIETAVDWPMVTPLMRAMEEAAHRVFADYGERVHAFTHLSHVYPQGSSIYSQYVWANAKEGYQANYERWQRLKAAVAQSIADHGGTASHQHGIGLDHAKHLGAEKGQVGLATIAALCHHFDPHQIMNPGKLIIDDQFKVFEG